jgi:glycosyltransferase involved in cell wall biosynthesis
MSEGPLVSIVSPSLNQGRYLEATVASVLSQDYTPVEYVVMDGGSTDESVDILSRQGGRLRYVSEPDGGQSAAINRGFQLTTGEILGWLNSDDTYEEGALSAVVQFFTAHPEVMLVYGDATFMDAEGRELGPCAYVEPFSKERLREADFIVQPAAFFRRSAFLDVGGLDESLHWSMDYDLWLRLAARFPVAYLPRRLARYRLTGQNKSAQGGFARLDELARVGRRHGAGGLPLDFRLEKLALSARECRRRAGAGDLKGALRVLLVGAGTVLSSPRALWRLVSPPGRRRPPRPAGP